MHQEISVPSGPPVDCGIDPLSPSNPFKLGPIDVHIFSLADSDYVPLSWPVIKAIVAADELEKLTRLPSQLRAYLVWSAKIRDEHGTIPNYILKHRLGWVPLPPPAQTDAAAEQRPMFSVRDPDPLADAADRKIMRNDWPYGLAAGIEHLCVWLKTGLPVAGETGALTARGRGMVQAFVDETFERGLGLEGQDRVLWFKNANVLQSVRAIEHFHVMVRVAGGDDGLRGRLEALLEGH